MVQYASFYALCELMESMSLFKAALIIGEYRISIKICTAYADTKAATNVPQKIKCALYAGYDALKTIKPIF